jgi:hypothetical protein
VEAFNTDKNIPSIATMAERLNYDSPLFHSSNDDECAPANKVVDIFRPTENSGNRRRVRPVVESTSSTSTASTWRYLCTPKYCAVPQFTLESDAAKEFFGSKVVTAVDLRTTRYSNRANVFEKELLSTDSGIVIPDCSEDEVSDYMSYDSSIGKDKRTHMPRRRAIATRRAQDALDSNPTIGGDSSRSTTEHDQMQEDSEQELLTRTNVSDEVASEVVAVTPTVVNDIKTSCSKMKLASKVVAKHVATVPIDTDYVHESSNRALTNNNGAVSAGRKVRLRYEIVDDSSFGLPAAESFDDDGSSVSSNSCSQRKMNTKRTGDSSDLVDVSVKPICKIDKDHFLSTPPVQHVDTPGFVDDNLFPPNITSLGWIPKLIIFLSSDKSDIVEAALIELAKLADVDTDDSDEDIIISSKKNVNVAIAIDENEKRTHAEVVQDIVVAFQYGVHASLIGVMNKWFRHPEIQLLTCSALHSFGAINENFRQAAYGLGALEALLQAMHNFRYYPEIQAQCCACLCCYSTNQDMAQHLLVHLNGLQTILQTMYEQPDNAFLQMWCCSALEYMASCHILIPYMQSNEAMKILLHVSSYFNDSTNTDHCLISHQAQTAMERLMPTFT